MRICLVTQELAGAGSYGGIGAAMLELALLLSRTQHIEVLYCPEIDPAPESLAGLRAEFAAHGIKFAVLDANLYVEGRLPQHRSYAVLKHLEQAGPFDTIHFHDWNGLGFYTQTAKRQGLLRSNPEIVVQIHGPTRWTLECNGILPEHPGHLRLDHMERNSIRFADHVVAPSRYILDWLVEHRLLANLDNCRVIKNVCASIGGLALAGSADTPRSQAIREVIFYGRHENRKGFSDFCGAVSKLNALLTEQDVHVTLLGPFGTIDGKPSGRVLTDRGRQWTFPLNVIPHLSRNDALAYLARASDSLVVIASPVENSPYTVLEAIALRKPLLTSCRGGARELIDPADHGASLFEPGAATLAEKIRDAILQGATAPRLAESVSAICDQWIEFHDRIAADRKPPVRIQVTEPPKVALGITTYERPTKLPDAVQSALRQSYPNLEVVVVDDGSSKPESLAALAAIEPRLIEAGGRLIRQENRYLGAARNTAARATRSDYLIFLDDDNILLPDMVETLVGSAQHTDADVTNCIVITMAENRRAEAIRDQHHFREKVRWIAMAGPLSIIPIENVVGDATSLIKRSMFEKVGGYSELRDVGFEDYEFFARVLQAGGKLEICPRPLYFYEVDRPSMLNTTNSARNFKRVFDSLDFSKNADDWTDLISVMVATRADEMHRALVEHAAATEPFGPELATLLQQPLDDMLLLLSDYAELVGAQGVRRAFRKALAALRNPFILAALGKPAPVPEIDNIELPDNPEMLRKMLLDRLAYVMDEGEPAQSVASVFGAAIKLRDTPTALSIFDSALRHDENEYLIRYPDVEMEGLYHFANIGRIEKRAGFPRLSAMCLSARVAAGFQVMPWELEDAILTLPHLPR